MTSWHARKNVLEEIWNKMDNIPFKYDKKPTCIIDIIIILIMIIIILS